MMEEMNGYIKIRNIVWIYQDSMGPDIFFENRTYIVTFLHLLKANLMQKIRKTNGWKYENFVWQTDLTDGAGFVRTRGEGSIIIRGHFVEKLWQLPILTDFGDVINYLCLGSSETYDHIHSCISLSFISISDFFTHQFFYNPNNDIEPLRVVDVIFCGQELYVLLLVRW